MDKRAVTRFATPIGRSFTRHTLLYVLLALGVGFLVALGFSISRRSAGAWVDSWAPNLATEAASILITVLVIERLLARQEAAKLQPRVEAAARNIAGTLEVWSCSLLLGELMRRPAQLPSAPSTVAEVVESVERLIRERPASRDPDWSHGTLSTLETLSNGLTRIRERDLDVITPSVVVAIDEMTPQTGLARLVRHLRLEDDPRGQLTPAAADDIRDWVATQVRQLATLVNAIEGRSGTTLPLSNQSRQMFASIRNVATAESERPATDSK